LGFSLSLRHFSHLTAQNNLKASVIFSFSEIYLFIGHLNKILSMTEKKTANATSQKFCY